MIYVDFDADLKEDETCEVICPNRYWVDIQGSSGQLSVIDVRKLSDNVYRYTIKAISATIGTCRIRLLDIQDY